MRILVTGGTGFIGKQLLKALHPHQITLLTRSSAMAKKKLAFIDENQIQIISSLDQLANLNSFDAVINLAGEPIANKRWSSRQKLKIAQSRWKITTEIVDLILTSHSPPSILISGSAIGYYGDQQQHSFDESLHPHTDSFTHYICQAWENIALKAHNKQTRVCLLRTGIVLGRQGGILQKLQFPFKLGLGCQLGNGEQYMPWIHIQDMVQAILFLLNNPQANGAFNICAPSPISNQEFTHQLAQAMQRPHFLTLPKWTIKTILGEASSLLLDSYNATPSQLNRLGFRFAYPDIELALGELFSPAK